MGGLRRDLSGAGPLADRSPGPPVVEVVDPGPERPKDPGRRSPDCSGRQFDSRLELTGSEELFVEFQQLVTGEVDPTDELSEFGAFAGIRDHPSRIKCATLGWHTLKAALDGTDKATTE